jgi:hypothetical protein
MRKNILALGIILLFIGIITFSISFSAEKTEKNQLIKRKEDLPIGKWEISAQFNKGEKLLVFFSRVQEKNLIVDGTAIIDINITCPKGGNTTFRVMFTDTYHPYANITLKSKDNDNGLIVNYPLEGIGGIAEYDGLYKVYVYSYSYLEFNYFPPNGTLPWLELYKVIEEKNYPYLILLPVAIALIIAGVSLSIWAAKTPKRPSRIKKKLKQR